MITDLPYGFLQAYCTSFLFLGQNWPTFLRLFSVALCCCIVFARKQAHVWEGWPVWLCQHRIWSSVLQEFQGWLAWPFFSIFLLEKVCEFIYCSGISFALLQNNLLLLLFRNQELGESSFWCCDIHSPIILFYTFISPHKNTHIEKKCNTIKFLSKKIQKIPPLR